MDKKLFECAQNPLKVFGSDLTPEPFQLEDVEKIYHFFNTADEFIGVFELKNGKFASIFHKKHPNFILDDVILSESVAYVASSYDEIIRLGLTNSTRAVLGIE